MVSNNPVTGDMVMFRYRSVAWIILAGVFGWIGEASAGWVIDQVMKGGGEGTRQQVLLQANRMKTLMLGEDGGPHGGGGPGPQNANSGPPAPREWGRPPRGRTRGGGGGGWFRVGPPPCTRTPPGGPPSSPNIRVF